MDLQSFMEQAPGIINYVQTFLKKDKDGENRKSSAHLTPSFHYENAECNQWDQIWQNYISLRQFGGGYLAFGII